MKSHSGCRFEGAENGYSCPSARHAHNKSSVVVAHCCIGVVRRYLAGPSQILVVSCQVCHEQPIVDLVRNLLCVAGHNEANPRDREMSHVDDMNFDDRRPTVVSACSNQMQRSQIILPGEFWLAVVVLLAGTVYLLRDRP
jgi:hypothetical protein